MVLDEVIASAVILSEAAGIAARIVDECDNARLARL